MGQRTVGEVMTREVVRVVAGAPFKEIAALLAEHGISGVPVVDAEQQVVGVVSESDLIPHQALLYEMGKRRPWRRWRRWEAGKARGRTAGELMSAPAVTVGPRDGLVRAAQAMDGHGVERLPVVDDTGRLVGIVTRRDLLEVFLRSDDEIRDEIVRDVLGRTLWLDPSTVDVTVRDGVVTLEGRLERRSKIPIAVRLARQVDGVVEVVDRLGWRVDDSTEQPQRTRR